MKKIWLRRIWLISRFNKGVYIKVKIPKRDITPDTLELAKNFLENACANLESYGKDKDNG